MHAHVLLNLSNKLRKRDKKQGFAKHFIVLLHQVEPLKRQEKHASENVVC